MTVDVTPLILAAISTLLPIILGYLANEAFKLAWPTIVDHIGQKNALLLQERVNHLLNAGIGFAVQHVSAVVTSHGAITLETRNLMVELAVKYASDHAPELVRDIGQVTDKVLARFDSHPAVQGLIAATVPMAQAA